MQIEHRFSGHEAPGRDYAPRLVQERNASLWTNRPALLMALAVLATGLPACQQAQPRLATAAVASSAVLAPAIALRQPRLVNFSAAPASNDVRFIANWVLNSGDNRQMPFVIIDKKNARIFVFDPAAKFLGFSPVLLGAAKGDDSVPGIGTRPLAQVLPEEKTTPAGRFVGEPGRNTSGEDIVWVDYDAAVSMHRVRTANPKERRLARLASPTTADNRISFGCVNMPPAFYENVLSPQFKARYGVVYVLPDVKRVEEVFTDAYDPARRWHAADSARRAFDASGKTRARL